MERSKYFQNGLITTLILVLFLPTIKAQTTNQRTIYEAYIQGDMKRWASVIQTIETNNTPVTVEQKLELINYYYGYTGYLLGRKRYDEAQTIIDKGDKLINQVLHTEPGNATAYAYKGSYIGFKIGLNKFKAMSLGPESSANISKALELDSQNIQAIIDKGNMLYHAPGFFGGNKNEALILFSKGAYLLEKSKKADHNWFYLNVLTLTARAYENMGQNGQAKRSYENILQKEPNFKWVRDELYPKLLKKMNNTNRIK